MINSEKKIAYIFYEGRDEKLHNAKYSKEFYYGYKQVIQHFNKTQLYEVTSSNISTKLVYLDKVFFKTFRLQFNISKFLNKDIINIFKNFDSIVLTNFGIAMSAIPIISIINRKKRKKIIVINSGLFNFHEANNFQKKIRLIYLQYAFKNISHLVFTSKAEFQAATQLFQNTVINLFANNIAQIIHSGVKTQIKRRNTIYCLLAMILVEILSY